MLIVVLHAALPSIESDGSLREPQTLVAGSSFKIEALISGVPTPTTSWSRDDQRLDATSTLAVYINDKSTKLTFNSLTLNEAGCYKVTAKNSVGSATEEFKIVVKGKCVVMAR